MSLFRAKRSMSLQYAARCDAACTAGCMPLPEDGTNPTKLRLERTNALYVMGALFNNLAFYFKAFCAIFQIDAHVRVR